MTNLDLFLTICHLALLVPLCLLGLHKAWMILLFARQRQAKPSADFAVTVSDHTPEEIHNPRVTIQLPVYNERFVVRRLIQAIAAIEFPRDRLQIQILDDSTDDTKTIIEDTLRELPPDLVVEHVRRKRRVGFKAGALAHGLQSATGSLIAVFDADFIPRPDFLARTVPEFADDKVGLVQARWGHTNRDTSVLTQVQALLLDGHFAIEQPARAANRCFFNFNGTAGIFRRECIEESGGWQHDTLTEDMDLSYRAQLAGWKFVYLPELCCPAELPTEMNGFLTQQHRWAKGSIQTGRKLSRRILRAPLPLITKVESVFHLFGNIAFPLLLGLILIAMPLQLTRWMSNSPVPHTLTWLEGTPLILATISVFAYYGLSQVVLRNFGPWTVLRLPLILVLGAGTCLNNTLAVLGGWRRHPGEFLRTPKFDSSPGAKQRRGPTYHSPRGFLPMIELLLAAWAGTTSALAFAQGLWAAGAFHGLFATGLFWVGLRSWWNNRRFRAMVPVALLAGCSGSGGGDNTPISAIVEEPEIVACQAPVGNEFALSEVVHVAQNGLGLDDLPSRLGLEMGVRVHPDGNRIVFTRERVKGQETSREIHLAALDGSPFDTRLTGNRWIDDSPCWSPQGDRILFSSMQDGDRDLWHMDPNGGDLTQVTTGDFADRDPDWREAGIVFSRTDPSATPPRARLFVTDGSGAAPLPLTDGGPGAGDFEPAWSPDGKTILFVRELAPGRQVLMQITPGQVVPTPIGDGGGEDRYPRWSPRGDRIFLVRSRPEEGLAGMRIFGMTPAGEDPVLLFPADRYAYMGFDLRPGLKPYPTLETTDTVADVGSGALTMRLGIVSSGTKRDTLSRDARSLAVRTRPFNGREVAGVLLTLNLPLTDPRRLAVLEIEVTAALSRADVDSFLRLALRDFVRQRYDTVLDVAPADTQLRTFAFRTSSLAHVDRNGQIRLEVIGDLSPGDESDLFIDHIGVTVRLTADQ